MIKSINFLLVSILKIMDDLTKKKKKKNHGNPLKVQIKSLSAFNDQIPVGCGP
jgi:hypothetical protein